jgi:hypothetical protein
MEFVFFSILNCKTTRKDSRGSGEILDNAILFIESLTNIKSDFIPGKEIMLVPSDKNLIDWKKWFKRNKKYLYWDEKEQKVKLKL